MRNKASFRAMPCHYCDKEAKVFSAYGREDGNGYMVDPGHIACENKGCQDKLIGDAAGGSIKILPLELSTVDGNFRDPIDRDKIKRFIKSVLGL